MQVARGPDFEKHCPRDLSGFPDSGSRVPLILPGARDSNPRPTARPNPNAKEGAGKWGQGRAVPAPETTPGRRRAPGGAGRGRGCRGPTHSQGADVARHDPGHPGGAHADDGLLGTAASGGAARQPPHLRARRDQARGSQQQEQPSRRPAAAPPQRHAASPVPAPAANPAAAPRARTPRRCRRGRRSLLPRRRRRRCWLGLGRRGCGRPSRSRAACWPSPPLGAPPPAPGPRPRPPDISTRARSQLWPMNNAGRAPARGGGGLAPPPAAPRRPLPAPSQELRREEKVG